MPNKPTWKPHTEHGKLTRQSDLPDSVFAFPEQRKEPLRGVISRACLCLSHANPAHELQWSPVSRLRGSHGTSVKRKRQRAPG